jgi:hypothetical protein
MVVREHRMQELKRDIYALEMDEMKRQNQQLYECLDRFENRDHNNRMLILFFTNNTMILMMILLLYIKEEVTECNIEIMMQKLIFLKVFFSSNIYQRRQAFDQDIQKKFQKQISNVKVKFFMILDNLWIGINHQNLM